MSKFSSEVQTAKTPCVPMPWLRVQHMRCHTPSFISEETAWCLEESGKNIRRISRVTNHQSSSSKKQHEYHIARTFVIASPSTVLSSCRSGSSVACDALFWLSTARFLLAQTHLARFGACAFRTQWSLHAVWCTLRSLSGEDLHLPLVSRVRSQATPAPGASAATCRMEDLHRRQQAVRGELQENRREMRRARRTIRREARRRSTLTLEKLTPGHRKQLLRMLHITGSDRDRTIACIDRASHPPAWGDLSVGERKELLSDLAAAHSAAEVHAWTNAMDPANTRALLYLWNLWAEHRVAEWVREKNSTRGVAPSSARVYEELQHQLITAPLTLRMHLRRVRTVNAKRKWAQRWRRNWGAVMGTLALGDVDDPYVLLTKARQKRVRPPRGLSI